jgi:hypothetical protein
MNRGRVGEERGGKETDRCPLTFPPPPFKVQCHDMQRPPGGCQVRSSERNLVEDGRIDIARCARVFTVELPYLQLCMDLCVHLPLIVTLIITFKRDQVV